MPGAATAHYPKYVTVPCPFSDGICFNHSLHHFLVTYQISAPTELCGYMLSVIGIFFREIWCKIEVLVVIILYKPAFAGTSRSILKISPILHLTWESTGSLRGSSGSVAESPTTYIGRDPHLTKSSGIMKTAPEEIQHQKPIRRKWSHSWSIWPRVWFATQLSACIQELIPV
jgi:hypothetical protein